jgi:D-alanyl-D-alanine carboxypeptidase
MTSHNRRFALPLLSLLFVACTAAPPVVNVSPSTELSPSPAAQPTSPPANEPPLASPTGTVSGTASPAPSAPPTVGPSPAATPSPIPTPSPIATPSPSLPAGPTATAPPLDARLARQLLRALEEERSAREIPGMSAVVIFPDGSRWTAAIGEADLGRGRPVEIDTPFVVGSITKTFVAALVLQLAEEGVLTLDDRLDRWLPGRPGAGEISLRQLLNHTSGVFNYFEHPRYNSTVFGGPQESWTPDEILAGFRRPGHFAPGAGFHYSNTGYILLGLVIEAATGSTLGDELRSRFFEPLDMRNTYFQGDGPPPRSAAQGYLRRQSGHREISDGSEYRPTTSAATVAWAAGGVVSSAEDIATWARALYGGNVLQPASLAQMIDVGATPHAAGTYGLGTRTRVFSGARAFGHTGSLRGFMGAMWHMPAEELTIVVLTNLGRIDANLISDRLAAIALGRR